MVDPATDEAQREAENEIEALAVAIEVAVLAVIARRLGAITKETTRTQLYSEMNKDLAEIDKIIQKGNNALQLKAKELMSRMANANDKWAEQYYKEMDVEQLLFRDNKALSQALKNGTRGALEDIAAQCRTSVIGISNGHRIAPLKDAYEKIVNEAASSMAIGEATYQAAVNESVATLSDAGLKVVYESGETRELYAAVRTNVMDAYRTTMVEMRFIQGAEFGADGVEVSAHVPCAIDHEEFQGRRFSYRAFQNVQNSLGRPLVTGANCHHTTYPIILGVGKSQYSKADRERMIRQSNEKVTFIGLSGRELSMSRYNATQYQRGVESKIRKTKTQAELLKQANMPTADVYQEYASTLTSYYKSMSKAAGIGTRMERTKSFTML